MGANFNDTLALGCSCGAGIAIAPSLFWAGASKETRSYATTMHRELGNGYEEVCMVQYHIWKIFWIEGGGYHFRRLGSKQY
jgi:hypothetical protein